ncbi:MAG: alpha/beta fold hydrolase [Gemmatimonadales bacterium]|nr:alpha/beta fold hydrolase [Gemmatimonadales bacterium]
MATSTLTKHVLAGALGDILVDVRAAGRESPRPAIVVVHGFKGFKDWGMFPPLAERLARAGFATVTGNLSGSGVDDAGQLVYPERFGRDTYSAELHDLGLLVEALVQGELGVPPPTTIGLVGHSRGGGIAVLHAARDRRVQALVTWAAISSVERWSPSEVSRWRKDGVTEIVNSRTGQRLPLYTDVIDDVERNAAGPLDILGAAARVEIPWLIVHGSADESVSPLESEALRAASPLEKTRLLTIEGAGHTFGAGHPWDAREHDTPQLRRVFDMTLAWFAAHLG